MVISSGGIATSLGGNFFSCNNYLRRENSKCLNFDFSPIMSTDTYSYLFLLLKQIGILSEKVKLRFLPFTTISKSSVFSIYGGMSKILVFKNSVFRPFYGVSCTTGAYYARRNRCKFFQPKHKNRIREGKLARLELLLEISVSTSLGTLEQTRSYFILSNTAFVRFICSKLVILV